MADDLTGLIGTVVAVGLVKKTSDAFLGKQSGFKSKVKLLKR